MTEFDVEKVRQKLKHTPGPWKMEPASRLSGAFVVFSETGNQGICAVYQDAEAEANARFIAAAPETAAELERVNLKNEKLLNTLRGVLVGSFDIECGDRLFTKKHVEKIRLAILEAEGKA